MSQTSQQPPAGWYPDPAGSGDERYWDGGTWSQVTRPAARGPVYGAPSRPSGQLAGWWWRVLASVVDSIVLMMPFALLQSLILGDAIIAIEQWSYEVLAAAERGATTLPALPEGVFSGYLGFLVVTMLLTAAYRVVLVATLGGTLGQLACRLRVVREGGPAQHNVGWGTSALRGVLAVVIFQLPIIGLVNALLPLFNRNKQTLHDLAAKTVVVKK